MSNKSIINTLKSMQENMFYGFLYFISCPAFLALLARGHTYTKYILYFLFYGLERFKFKTPKLNPSFFTKTFNVVAPRIVNEIP